MPIIYTDKTENLPERVKQDVYPTNDVGLIKKALWIYAPRNPENILDIGAGDGRWGELAKQTCPFAELTGVDIRELPKPQFFDHWYDQFDFSLPLMTSTTFPEKSFDLVVSNSPFYCATQIIKNAWPLMADDSTMIMLLKLEFMISQNRYLYLWKDFSPVEVAPIVKRLEFTGPGNPNEYAVFVWRKEDGQNAATPYVWRTHLLWHERDIRE